MFGQLNVTRFLMCADVAHCIVHSNTLKKTDVAHFCKLKLIFTVRYLKMEAEQMEAELGSSSARPGWRLIEITAMFLDGPDTCAFVCTHFKACGMIGIERPFLCGLLKLFFRVINNT